MHNYERDAGQVRPTTGTRSLEFRKASQKFACKLAWRRTFGVLTVLTIPRATLSTAQEIGSFGPLQETLRFEVPTILGGPRVTPTIFCNTGFPDFTICGPRFRGKVLPLWSAAPLRHIGGLSLSVRFWRYDPEYQFCQMLLYKSETQQN